MPFDACRVFFAMFTTIAEILRCQLIAIDLELCFGIFVDVPGKSSNLFGGLTFSRSRGSSPPLFNVHTPGLPENNLKEILSLLENPYSAE